jgi:hypothetical protein
MSNAPDPAKTLADFLPPDQHGPTLADVPASVYVDEEPTTIADQMSPFADVSSRRQRLAEGTGTGGFPRAPSPSAAEITIGDPDDAETVVAPVPVAPEVQAQQLPPVDPFAAPSETLLNDVGSMLAVIRKPTPKPQLGYEHVAPIVAASSAAQMPALRYRIGDGIKKWSGKAWRPVADLLGGFYGTFRLAVAQALITERCFACKSKLSQFECKLALPVATRQDIFVRAVGKDWSFFRAMGVAPAEGDYLALYLAHCGNCGSDSRLQIVERRGLRSFVPVNGIRLTQRDVFSLFCMTDPR